MGSLKTHTPRDITGYEYEAGSYEVQDKNFKP